MQCANNLKQIGLGAANYESSYGVFPPLYMNTRDPTRPGVGLPDTSPFLRLLPYTDGAAAYAAYNMSFAAVDLSNLTVSCSAIGTFQCPSDPSATSPVDLASRIGNTSTTYASKFGYYSALPPGPGPCSSPAMRPSPGRIPSAGRWPGSTRPSPPPPRP